MADQLRLRGGPTAESQTFVGAEREVTVDTGLKALRVHDGVTPGGHLIELKADAESSRNSAALLDTNARSAIQAALNTAITNYQTSDASTLTSAQAYTDTAITNLVGGSPALLDTLNEIAAAINDDADFFTTISASIAGVQADVNQNEADCDSAIATVQADVDANETAANAAIAVVQADVDANEAATATSIANTNSAVAAVQADVDGNESDCDAASSALSTRITALEADPTTAAAVAAVQADVDANETTAATAVSSEATTRASAVY